MIFQATGASVAMLLLKYFFKSYPSHPSVNYIVTQPGKAGIVVAIAEFPMSFFIFLVVMIVSNSRFAKYNGYFAGALVFILIGWKHLYRV